MYVAKSRQKPPENAFQMRARMKAEAEAAEAAKAAPAAPVPDIDALREAAARAAALVHGAEPERVNAVESGDMRGHEVLAVAHDEVEAFKQATVGEPPEANRGRPASPDVAERTARVLELITEAGAEGISKAALAESVGAKEANVQVSLGKLKGAGKVESRRVPEINAYRWFAV